jgi:branched-chain amino acid aminotransferase
MRIWLNGVLAPASEPAVSAFDHGLLTGDGVFETLRVYDGRPFAMRRHLERLAASAAALRLPLPAEGVLRAAAHEVIVANRLVDARLRITVTGGLSPLGSDRGGEGPTVIVAGGPLPAWPASAEVVTVPWARNERSAVAGLKTISYAENVVALAYARERGAGEAVFGNTVGALCEGTGTNVFLCVAGSDVLVTPPLSSGCLAGVTRALLLEAGAAVEADVPLAALATASEAFLSSSTREVQPVAAVDGVALPSCPGPLTAAAAAAFAAVVTRSLDP